MRQKEEKIEKTMKMEDTKRNAQQGEQRNAQFLNEFWDTQTDGHIDTNTHRG